MEAVKSNLKNNSVLKNIIYFSLPFLLSFFLQTLYGLADLFIIGQFNTTSEITAVSLGSQVMHMFTVMIVGLSMGATVLIAQSVGANKPKLCSKAIGNTISLFLVLSIIVTLLLLSLTRPITKIMFTPEDALEGTLSYLTICFIGIPFITAYNIISSIFRGLGDSKSPMKFVIVACILNIVLDLFFIGVLKLGPKGAALATVISQAFSVFIAIIFIKKKKISLISNKSDLTLDKKVLKPILKVGIPIAIQDGFIQVAFILVSIIANKRGLYDAAAVGIVEKIIGFVFLVPSAMLSTVSALSSQYIGSEEYKKASDVLKYAILICSSFGLVISLLVQFIAPNLIYLFDKNPYVVKLGSEYLHSYIWDVLFAGIHFSFSGYFCALGKSNISFLHNALSIILVRIPGAYFMSKLYSSTLFPMGLAAPLGSLLSVFICIIAYSIVKKNQSSLPLVR